MPCMEKLFPHLDNDNNDDDYDGDGDGDNDDDYNGKSGEDYHFSVPGLSISKNCPVVALEYALWK